MAARPATRLAARSTLAVAGFVILTALATAADLASKHLVFQSLLSDPALRARPTAFGDHTAKQALRRFQRPVWAGVKFTLSVNPGVAFGMPMPRWLVAAATVTIVALVLYFFATTAAKARSVHVGLALILGGALGNFYDRLLAKVSVEGFEPIRYQVRDFIDCSALHYPWVFNLADAWLVIGVAILMLHWLFVGRKLKTPGAPR